VKVSCAAPLPRTIVQVPEGPITLPVPESTHGVVSVDRNAEPVTLTLVPIGPEFGVKVRMGPAITVKVAFAESPD
jgi:hypothetical protein